MRLSYTCPPLRPSGLQETLVAGAGPKAKDGLEGGPGGP